jgi:hypothetical protein
MVGLIGIEPVTHQLESRGRTKKLGWSESLDADQATMLLAEIKSAPVDVIESEERLLDRRWVCAGV